MTPHMKINAAKNWIVSGLKTHYTLKLAFTLVLGALLLATTTGFPFGKSGADTVAPEQVATSVEHDMFDHLPEGTHWGMDAEVEWGFNKAAEMVKETTEVDPSYDQQRAADRHQENLDILQGLKTPRIRNGGFVPNRADEAGSSPSVSGLQNVPDDARRFDSPFYDDFSNSFAGSDTIFIVEDSEMYDMYSEGTHWGTAYPLCWGMNHPACPSSDSTEQQSAAETIECELADYGHSLGYEQFNEIWSELLGRAPSSEPTICEIDQYAVRYELEERLFAEMWETLRQVEAAQQNDIDPVQARLGVGGDTSPVIQDFDLRFNDP